ncbi:MAG: hypothetical protein JW744_05650 [Candidatus Diapherotrites archaeon]|uniref:Uncharacterized protein n=1 Tax=Candidatus Iainarchaeum sp. TaxID=3101447 RepID=A0A939CAM5_9ARCH|nr:hypothetical protein [Candidatus Diapherotrites archaeon]
MRRFKSTPQKKFIGMAILFVLIPLFLLFYALFIIDWRPRADTIIIVAAIAALFFYLYRRYKMQSAEQAELEGPMQPEEGEFSDSGEGSGDSEDLPVDSGEELEEPVDSDEFDEEPVKPVKKKRK